jgi:CHAT domain-containing protein/tetratricopeptide (TPR) repeat protein
LDSAHALVQCDLSVPQSNENAIPILEEVIAMMVQSLRCAVVLIAVTTGATGVQSQGADDLAALRAQVTQLHDQGKYAEAIPIAERYVALAREKYGEKHAEFALATSTLGYEYEAQGRYAEAEPLYGRARAIIEAIDPEHPIAGTTLSNLARVYRAQGRYAEAEPLYTRALAINEKAHGPDHRWVGSVLSSLASLYREQGRYAEAEPLLRRALGITEKAMGPEHAWTSAMLNNLAGLYVDQGRYADAEPLYKRDLAVTEKKLGPDHPEVGKLLNNLADVYGSQGRYAEAEPLFTRALAITERALGPNHPDVGVRLNNLAALYFKQGGYAQAEPLFRRALAITEEALGPSHADVGSGLNNLAELYRAQGRYAEAEPLFKRALSIRTEALGPDHPDVGGSFNNLAGLYFERGDWKTATTYWRQSTDLLIRRSKRGAEPIGGALTGQRKSDAARHTYQFGGLVKATYRLAQGDKTQKQLSEHESFKVAQWAQSSEAAASLAQMAARQARGDNALARLVRERQDLVGEWQTRDRALITARSAQQERRNAGAEQAIGSRLAAIDGRVGEIDKTLAKDFPDYAALAGAEPLTIAEVQALLRADEALVLILDTREWRPAPEETFVWAITKTATHWVRSELGTKALVQLVATLRCGLDRDEGWQWAADKGRWLGRKPTCVRLRPDGLAADEPLPFSLAIAHELYETLFGSIKNEISGKQLLIVPSGPLTQLPFQVLMTEKPGAVGMETDVLRRAEWLAKSNAITVLPAVSSLKALREHARTSRATKALIGFGNPLLVGPHGTDRRAWEKQSCPKTVLRQRVARDLAAGVKLPQQRGGLVDVSDIRALTPLPETADELCGVAGDLGLPDGDIRLCSRAIEHDIKSLSTQGELAAYCIVHFATHGAVAGELSSGSEPGLILTPPETATPEDDGYLSASEIASLQLDADWVILSACNTGAGGAEGAEALSGLARAFFYAGARALLVSHWAVDSAATVKLVTKTLRTMSTDKTSRSEALRRSMMTLIQHGQPHEAHPTYWAPFVVVGEGGRAHPTDSSSASPVPAQAKKTVRRPPSKTPQDWAIEFWKQRN